MKIHIVMINSFSLDSFFMNQKILFNYYQLNFFFKYFILAMKTLCLNMIVKNEKKIIKRCLDSVYKYLDYWVICDTGSTDGTQEFIINYFKKKGIKGELYEVKWVNFGYNRQESIQKAYNKTDYIILLDADFQLNVIDKNFKNKLSENSYLIKYDSTVEYYNLKLVSGKYLWKYKGVTHEYIYSDEINERGNILDGVTIIEKYDGSNRTIDKKFKRDIKLLEQGIKDEPDNSRYYFYLANSYYDIGDYQNAIKYYKIRSIQNGYKEEVYLAKYKYALSKMKLNIDMEIIIKYFYEAFNILPTRLESLYKIIKYFRKNENFKEGYKYGLLGLNNLYKYNNHYLFVDKYIENIAFPDELSICAYYSNNYKLSLLLIDYILLKKDNLSKINPEDYKRITNNRNLTILKLNEIKSNDPKIETFEATKRNICENYYFYSPIQINKKNKVIKSELHNYNLETFTDLSKTNCQKKTFIISNNKPNYTKYFIILLVVYTILILSF